MRRYLPALICTLTIILLVCLYPAEVYAQLTSEDIANLQQQAVDEGWTFTVSPNPATEYSLDELCGLVPPENWWENQPFDPMTDKIDLPSHFDWRDSTTLPPVRNQGGCGSCWAFATVGPFECNIKIKDGIVVDLSEQWLVSCNRDGWGCSGGWWAHSYHSTKGDQCNGKYAVMESSFPYAGWDKPCSCPYEHTYHIQGWSYIGSQNGIPPVDAIKQAIITYGPVSVAVVANSAMQSYSGGIFNSCGYGDVNHGVVLVGWDDSLGDNGVWFMRNSWGSWWGEGGYMKIQYGCSKIGYGASYVNYAGAVQITTQNLPACSLSIPYAAQLECSGGVGTIQWSDMHGSLEGSGLTLSADGMLSGIPENMAPLSFTAYAEDAYQSSDQQPLQVQTIRTYMCGDANYDRTINVGDAVYVITYVFRNGPDPLPATEAGDANADDAVNVADAVFVINYVFKSGLAPACP